MFFQSTVLKPCPFCGEKLIVKEDDDDKWIEHGNSHGPCLLLGFCITDKEEIEEWSTRAKESE